MRRTILLSTLLFLACGGSTQVVRNADTDDDHEVTIMAESSGGSPGAPRDAMDEDEPSPSAVAPTRDRRRPRRDVRRSKASKRPVKTTVTADAPTPPPPPTEDPEPERAAEKLAKKPSKGAVDDLLAKTRAAAPEVPKRRARKIASPGVKAGAADDNLQFGAYLDFLSKHARRGIHRNVSDRVVVEVRDASDLPIQGATVQLVAGRRVLQKRRTYADGRTIVFPSEASVRHRQELAVDVRYRGETKRFALGDHRTHALKLTMSKQRREAKRIPLDIAFVLDTTGSMGDEILSLKQTLAAIHFQITHISPAPDVRIGMVLFRDRGDEYVTQHVPFTGDVEAFARRLAAVQAGGGNDYPEDVQAGLESALHDLKWRKNGVKIAFLVGDAPPHTDYDQDFNYQSAAQEAAERGIKIATIGASGLSEMGELVWRQIAQYTMSPFVFLTYGEKGDSGAGSPALVSHHIGSNWVAENLDAIIVRMVKVELAHLSPRGAPVREDFFSATSAEDVPPDTILEDLFARSVKQLLDYSVERIAPRTPTVIMPLAARATKADKEKLERRLMVGLSRRAQFQLLERGEQQKILATIAEQLSEKYDANGLTEVGKLVPAELAVLSSVAPGKKGEVEMLVKLVRLQTGEVLSLSLLKIDEALVL